jgi:glycine cleavage system H protein
VGYPDDVRYTKDHEWAREEGGVVTVGITSYATDQLGDVVFVEMPEVGAEFARDQDFGVIESSKAVSSLYAPVSGRVVAVNAALRDTPELINNDVYGEGWIIKVEVSDPAELAAGLTREQYEAEVASA